MASDKGKIGNGVMGIRKETHSKWERRAPLTPAHCAELLRLGRAGDGARRILIQPCTKRVHSDQLYSDAGCEISEDLSACGLIIGVKRPQADTLLPNKAYVFFSHTHKAQPENMALLDEILRKGVTLYDYERIVEDGRRLVAFGEYAGMAGTIDFLRGLGERYLNLGFSTPFLSLGSSYMSSSLTSAKAAVKYAGDEIANNGLPSAICPLVFVFTGTGKVSIGAQEIFKLLPHEFVQPSELQGLFAERRPDDNRKVFGCVVEAHDMVVRKSKDPSKNKKFDKEEYYKYPDLYRPIFHETIAPFTSVLVNCMYWEEKYPKLLDNAQLTALNTTHFDQRKEARFLGVADITCDIEGSVECLNKATPIEQPFFRYDPAADQHHDGKGEGDIMDGQGIIVLAVDCLPTELAKEATQHFGNVLLPFISQMAVTRTPDKMVPPIEHACIAHDGQLRPDYKYIQALREAATAAALATVQV